MFVSQCQESAIGLQRDTRVVKFSLGSFQDTCASCSSVAALACPVYKCDISQSAHERYTVLVLYRNVVKCPAVLTIGYVLVSMPMYDYGSHLFSPVSAAQTTVTGLHVPDLTIVTAVHEAIVVIVTVPNGTVFKRTN
jgi:hypothetical protein